MINKKNLLGKTPHDLNEKDAIHVAIVSVRAACAIEPGTKCGLNQFKEAIPDSKGVGIADPWRRHTITRGETFWLLLNQDEVPNVKHVWEHPTAEFGVPTRDVLLNAILLDYANYLGITYKQLMDACEKVVESGRAVKYPGNKTAEEREEAYIDKWQLWAEWAGETNYEFPNMGTECCPEYEYPQELFTD
jgi:hypothetical protein